MTPAMYHSQPPRLPIPNHKTLEVVTNSFQITQLPKATYYQYDVFTPEFTGKAFVKKKEYVHHLQTVIAPDIFHPALLYDGGAVAYAHVQAAQNIGSARTFNVDLRCNVLLDAHTAGQSSKKFAKIEFKRTTGIAMDPQEILKVVQATQDTDRREATTNFLQLILRQGTNNRNPNNGKAYYVLSDRRAATAGGGRGGRGGRGGPGGGHGRGGPPTGSPMNIWLHNGLEIRRGIFHSVRPTIGKMVVTIDTVATAFYRAGPLWEAIGMFLNDRDLPRLPNTSHSFVKMTRFFKGARITISQPPKPSPPVKTIRGFIAHAGEYKFTHNGVDTTVKDYYRMAYNYTLQYPKGPGVLLRHDPPIIIPIEVCTLVEDQIFRKKLPEDCTREMVAFATMRPAERLSKIRGAASTYGSSETMAQAGMTVDTNPMVIRGKLLQPPPIEWQGSTMAPTDGSWNVLGKRLHDARPLKAWAILNCTPMDVPMDYVQHKVVGMFSQCAQALGMGSYAPLAVMPWIEQRIENSLERIMAAVVQNAGSREVTRQLVLIVILPQEGGHLRDKLKNWGDVAHGIRTQCLRAKAVGKMNSQYANNVLLKINARLGGSNFAVQKSITMKEIANVRTMIVGADVSHPGPGIRTKPSVTSLVWSVDRYATRYEAQTRIQRPRVEIIEALQEMFVFALERFSKKAGGTPENIIVFRDGVSEGEFKKVSQHEIKAIEGACKDLYAKYPGNFKGEWKPRITFIVVTKRHHTLLFPPQGSELDDRKGNCKAGTTVDSGITQPFFPNFYLQSHAAIQGTSRSGHYIILRDDVFGCFENNMLLIQDLAFTLCHVYAKATRSVSIPAPVYYADLVCSRCNFHVDPDQAVVSFADNASMNTTDSEEFNIDQWNRVFKNVNGNLSGTMYFL